MVPAKSRRGIAAPTIDDLISPHTCRTPVSNLESQIDYSGIQLPAPEQHTVVIRPSLDLPGVVPSVRVSSSCLLACQTANTMDVNASKFKVAPAAWEYSHSLRSDRQYAGTAVQFLVFQLAEKVKPQKRTWAAARQTQATSAATVLAVARFASSWRRPESPAEPLLRWQCDVTSRHR